jgi:tetratricopeptide (TPR) repeat protein
MEEVGRKAGEELAKSALGKIKAKIKSALELGEGELEVGPIRARAPSVEKTKELVDYGVESLLKLPQTRELLSKAGKKELEDPLVRRKKIKGGEDPQRLVETPKVEALPEQEKLRFRIFAFIAYGDERFHSRAFPEAEKDYRQAYEFAGKLDDKPLQGVCLNLIGAAIGMQDRHEEALSCFDEAIRLNPDFAEAWYDKGATLGKLGQHGEALSCFDEAIRLNRDYAQAWHHKGTPLDELGQHEEALSCYDEAIRLKPDFPEAWYDKGVTLANLGRHEEALSSYDEAIRLEPDFAEAWYNKGVTLGQLGRDEEAVSCYDEAIRLNRDYAQAWNNKGTMLGKLGRYKEALSCFDDAAKLKPDHTEAWYNKGLTLSSLGRYEEALSCFDEAIRLGLDLAEPWYEKVILTLEQGLESVASRNMKQAEEGALELVELRKEADKDGMAQVVDEAVLEFKGGLSRRELKLFDEFELMLTVLSIEDPLERWKTLAEKIGEKWPKGVSAVEAIRKERQ